MSRLPSRSDTQKRARLSELHCGVMLSALSGATRVGLDPSRCTIQIPLAPELAKYPVPKVNTGFPATSAMLRPSGDQTGLDGANGAGRITVSPVATVVSVTPSPPKPRVETTRDPSGDQSKPVSDVAASTPKGGVLRSMWVSRRG